MFGAAKFFVHRPKSNVHACTFNFRPAALSVHGQMLNVHGRTLNVHRCEMKYGRCTCFVHAAMLDIGGGGVDRGTSTAGVRGAAVCKGWTGAL